MFIELTALKKLRTNAGETKAMQPVNLTIALLLSDDQRNHLVNQHTLPRVSQLEVLPGGASTPLWDALLHMPKERQHVALGVQLADSPLEAFASRIGCRIFSRILCLFFQEHWHDSWAHLVHPVVCQVLRGRHGTQVSQASRLDGIGYDDPLSSLLASWLEEDKVYAEEWTPQLLAGL